MVARARRRRANVRSETHVFHNGWYGYKNYGIGLAAYASFYENPRAPEILKTVMDANKLLVTINSLS